MHPDRINTCRGVTTWAVRAAAAVLLIWGAYLVLKRIVLAVLNNDPSSAFFAWEGIGESQPFYCGAAMLLIGGVLAFGSRQLARWIILPMPEGCPRCGYEKIESDRCPECGLKGFGPPPAA